MPAGTLYALAVAALARLDVTPIARVRRWEAYHRAAVGRLLGLAPRLDACAACGRELPEPAPARLAFSIEEGGVLCGGCAASRPGASALAGEAYGLLQLYHHPEYGLVSALGEGTDAEARVQEIVRRFLAWHAGVSPAAAGLRGEA
jgi:recombinational DNA repair protein (RecF pathway)